MQGLMAEMIHKFAPEIEAVSFMIGTVNSNREYSETGAKERPMPCSNMATGFHAC